MLLVSVFVLCVVFARAEGRAFHLPGGDGTIIMLAGGWAAILIFYRMLDKPGLHTNGVLYTEGITWGIFIALFVALGLSYAGWRMRLAARPEAQLPVRARDTRDPRRSDAGESPPAGRPVPAGVADDLDDGSGPAARPAEPASQRHPLPRGPAGGSRRAGARAACRHARGRRAAVLRRSADERTVRRRPTDRPPAALSGARAPPAGWGPAAARGGVSRSRWSAPRRR